MSFLGGAFNWPRGDWPRGSLWILAMRKSGNVRKIKEKICKEKGPKMDGDKEVR